MSIPTGPITPDEIAACNAPLHNPGDLTGPDFPGYLFWPTAEQPAVVPDTATPGRQYRIALINTQPYPTDGETPYQLQVNAEKTGLERVADVLHTLQVNVQEGNGPYTPLARYLAKPGTRLRTGPGTVLQVTAPGYSRPPRYYLTLTRLPEGATPDCNIPLLENVRGPEGA